MGEIDWEALLEGREPEPVITEGEISGLLTVNSEISISASTHSAKESSRAKSVDLSESGSFGNLQSVNDLLSFPHSPSPEVPASRSAVSVRSNVTFSENIPEVYNIGDDFNLLSIGDLIPEDDFSEEVDIQSMNENVRPSSRGGRRRVDSVPISESPDKMTETYTEIGGIPGNIREYSEIESVVVTESKFGEDDFDSEEIAEEIEDKRDNWTAVKGSLDRESENQIPVFMVGKKKRSSSKSLSEFPKKGSRRQSNFSAKSNRKSLDYTSDLNDEKTLNYTSYTDDVTTVSETSTISETVTKSRTSVTKVKFEAPCCKCKCENQIADVNIRPIPLFSGVTLDSRTLNEISAMNPDKIALLNMMKAQYNLTKGLIDITSNILNSELDDCKPSYRHTNLSETRKYIRRNQPFGDNKHRQRLRSGKRSNRRDTDRNSRRDSDVRVSRKSEHSHEKVSVHD